jgi:hypothetical protein
MNIVNAGASFLKTGAYESIQAIGSYFGPVKDFLVTASDKIVTIVSIIFSKIAQLFDFHSHILREGSPTAVGTGASKCPVMRAKNFIYSSMNWS